MRDATSFSAASFGRSNNFARHAMVAMVEVPVAEEHRGRVGTQHRVGAEPAHMPHEAVALEDTVDIDFFAPRREEWIRGDDAYLRQGIKKD